jgi:hypothetical protein
VHYLQGNSNYLARVLAGASQFFSQIAVPLLMVMLKQPQ